MQSPKFEGPVLHIFSVKLGSPNHLFRLLSIEGFETAVQAQIDCGNHRFGEDAAVLHDDHPISIVFR